MRGSHWLVVRGALIGTVVGGWTALWWIGLLVLVDRGFFLHSFAIPEEHAHLVDFSSGELVETIGAAFRIDPPTNLWQLAVLLVALCALAGVTTGFLAWVTRLDSKALALDALAWTARSACEPPSIAVLLTGLATPVLLSASEGAQWLWVALPVGSLWVIALLVQPLVLCREVVAARPGAARWWVGPFPVLRRLGLSAAFLALWVLSRLLPALLSLPLRVFGSLVAQVAGWYLLLLGVALLATPVRLQDLFRGVLRWRVLSPWLALHLVLLIAVPAVLAGPWGAAYVLHWKIVPVLATLLDSIGAELPSVWRFVLSSYRLIERFHWILFALPGFFIYWLAAGRVVWLGFRDGEGGEQGRVA